MVYNVDMEDLKNWSVGNRSALFLLLSVGLIVGLFVLGAGWAKGLLF